MKFLGIAFIFLVSHVSYAGNGGGTDCLRMAAAGEIDGAAGKDQGRGVRELRGVVRRVIQLQGAAENFGAAAKGVVAAATTDYDGCLAANAPLTVTLSSSLTVRGN